MASLTIFTTISLTSSLAISLTSSLPMSSTPSIACIDDSDCTSLGHKYACYLYQCINWMDKDTGMEHCNRDEQCGHARTCYRPPNHHDPSSGLCFSSIQLQHCSDHSSCSGYSTSALQYCCGRRCCPLQYYRHWRQFSCVTDTQCRQWNTGDRCCQGGRCYYQEEEEEEEVRKEVTEEVTEEVIGKVKEDLSVKASNANNVKEKLIETPNAKEELIVNTREDTTVSINVKQNNPTVDTLKNENESEKNGMKDLIDVVDETKSVGAGEEDFPAKFSDLYFNKFDEEAENNEQLVSLSFTKPLPSPSLAVVAVHKLWLLCVLTLHWMR